jgi:hypothetical protein
MDSGRPTIIHPGMTAGGINREEIALYSQTTVVHLPQSHAFHNQIGERLVIKAVDNRAHPTQVPQAFLAHIGDQPDISGKRRSIGMVG